MDMSENVTNLPVSVIISQAESALQNSRELEKGDENYYILESIALSLIAIAKNTRTSRPGRIRNREELD